MEKYYWLLDGFCFLLGLISFILCYLLYQVYWLYSLLCLAWIPLYPFLNQFLLNLLTPAFTKYSPPSPNSHVVYHPNYEITFCGLQSLHPFDSRKYTRIYSQLLQNHSLREQEVITPQRMPRGLLLEVVSKVYLLKMCYTLPICKYIQMPLFFIPGFLLRYRVLDPMLLATEGSVLAATAALYNRWAVNLSGGYHHATAVSGAGFCIYPDITLILHYLRTRLHITKIMIIDLDVHQGNGYERDILRQTQQTFIIDCFNHFIYPRDWEAAEAIGRKIQLTYGTEDREYMGLISVVEEDIQRWKPQFVVYNAGTDILVGDPLGQQCVSESGIVERDQFIVGNCIRRNIPVVMLLSGGYQMSNAGVIATSIMNLMQKFD